MLSDGNGQFWLPEQLGSTVMVFLLPTSSNTGRKWSVAVQTTALEHSRNADFLAAPAANRYRGSDGELTPADNSRPPGSGHQEEAKFGKL